MGGGRICIFWRSEAGGCGVVQRFEEGGRLTEDTGGSRLGIKGGRAGCISSQTQKNNFH